MTAARRTRTRTRTGPLAWLAVAVGLAAACEHPIAMVTPHIEAADLVVSDSAGTVIARTEVNRTWLPDSIVLREGQPLRLVLTPIDFRGQPIDIAQRRDISFRMEAGDGALLQWEPLRGYGWLRPFAPGVTHLRFLIWHETHADLVTPWLRVVIRPAAHEQTNTTENGNEP
jgi:hypothetical protein